MADERRMTTDRFFGGVDGRLSKLQSMLTYVGEAEPAEEELWTWLERNTDAGSESTIEKYVQFLRSISLLELLHDHYVVTDQGSQFAESEDVELIFDALTTNVKGFETILQAIENGDRTEDEIQERLQEQYPSYSLPSSIVGRHLEWLKAVGAVEDHRDRFVLTGFGQQKVSELDSGRWLSTSKSSTESQNSIQDSKPKSPDEKLETLRKQAERDATTSVSVTTEKREVTEYDRSEKVRHYVKERADGVCEGCGEDAPFISRTGEPYLQAHHIHELADRGPDTPETVIALCPNCHYRVHHGNDGPDYNRELRYKLTMIEDTSIDEIYGDE